MNRANTQVKTPARLAGCLLATAQELPDPVLSAGGRINALAGQARGSATSAVARN
jgi:hypothetical protein